MRDHRAHAGIRRNRAPERPEPPSARAGTLHQPQRLCGEQEAPRRGFVQPKADRKDRLRQRALAQDLEQPELDARDEHLRIDEAGAEVEKGRGPPPGDGPGQPEPRREASRPGWSPARSPRSATRSRRRCHAVVAGNGVADADGLGGRASIRTGAF